MYKCPCRSYTLRARKASTIPNLRPLDSSHTVLDSRCRVRPCKAYFVCSDAGEPALTETADEQRTVLLYRIT